MDMLNVAKHLKQSISPPTTNYQASKKKFYALSCSGQPLAGKISDLSMLMVSVGHESQRTEPTVSKKES